MAVIRSARLCEGRIAALQQGQSWDPYVSGEIFVCPANHIAIARYISVVFVGSTAGEWVMIGDSGAWLTRYVFADQDVWFHEHCHIVLNPGEHLLLDGSLLSPLDYHISGALLPIGGI